MALFREAKNEMAYLKCGILGFAGSGKSFTAALIAIELAKFGQENSLPVLFLDSETGSDFLVRKFEEAEIKLEVAKTRAFVDLLKAIDEAEERKAILIVDSISHFWTEILDAYLSKKKKERISLHDWIPIKQEWREYTDRYINSKIHIIMCGRAGWEFDYEKDEDGVLELTKTGTRMKAETEMGYEPSLLLEMERVRRETGKIGGSHIHRCWVIKDRFDKINGKFFDDPTFKDFLPHIELLNLGGEHRAVNGDRTSEGLFNSTNSKSEYYKRKDITLEEIKDELTLIYGKTDTDKKESIRKLKEIFGTSSKTGIENLALEALQEGLKKIKELKEAKEFEKLGKNKEGETK